MNGELSNPEADGIADGASEFVDLTRRQTVVLALAIDRTTALTRFGNVGWAFLTYGRFVHGLTGHVDTIRRHCTKFTVVVAKIVVVVSADTSGSRNKHGIGSAVGRPQK